MQEQPQGRGSARASEPWSFRKLALGAHMATLVDMPCFLTPSSPPATQLEASSKALLPKPIQIMKLLEAQGQARVRHGPRLV